jgi:predicted nucleic acid-binding protein
MKCYADSSFIMQLLLQDFATGEAKDCYRALGSPPLICVCLHTLEVSNALRLRLFATATSESRVRAATKRETGTGLRRFKHMLNSGYLLRTPVDMDDAFVEAASLSELHTQSIGARALDTLHVAAARLLNADRFLTCDQRQAKLATRAGLKVRLIGNEK